MVHHGINALNQLFVDTVRAAGGYNASRYLMCPGYCACPEGVLTDDFVLPQDPGGAENRIILSVHAYRPYNFALEPGGTSTFSASNKGDTKDIDWFINQLYKKFIQNGVPVVVGETAFTDNAPHRVVDFVKAAFGAEHLTANLNFIEATLGKTLEAYLAKEFWDEHKRTYNFRPIYWLFRSKKGAFQALVYMHRMDAYTATKVRNGYLLPHIEFLRGRIAAESARGAELTAKERTKLKKMQQAMEECLEYDGRLHVVADRMQGIDLDDGVAVNYAKFGDVLAKLK